MSFASGKVILLGEHSVVYGRPAIAMSIERGVRAKAVPDHQWSLAIAPWGKTVTPDDRNEDDAIARAFAVILRAYSNTPPLRIEAEVELPAGAGLGCSAALGVAIVRAIDEATAHERSTDELVDLSLEWERVFHGNPSGIDNTLAARGGLCLFKKGAPIEAIRPRKSLQLVIGDSGEPSATRAMVEEVKRQRDRDEARIEKVFDGIAALVTNAKLSIEYGDLRDLGKLMDLNHALLNALMLSTARLEEMCAAARHAGALGAKLTGAGGGGCMIALVEDDEIGARVEGELHALSRRAFRVQTYAP